MRKICVVIPVYNEARYIGSLIDELREQGIDAVIIDDGSTDQTRAVAKKKGAVVIHHEQRGGKGCSLRDGFVHALKKDYDGILTMDGDGQHSVGDIPRFMQIAENNPSCLIVGNRMNDTVKMPLLRYCTNRFMSWLISTACRQKIEDTQCGFRYISRDILQQLKLRSTDFEIETEILMQASKRGFRVHSVPIKTIYSDEVSKIKPFKDAVRFFSYFFKEIISSST